MATFKPSRIIAGVMNWGTWGAKLDTDQLSTLTKQCLDLGVTTIDHADIYGDHTTEAQWGAGFAKSGIARRELQLITKCGIMMPSEQRPGIEDKHYDTTKAHIIRSVEQSLSNLCTDYIDLLLIHRPSPLMQPAVVADAMKELQQSGKVLHFGVSNFTPSQVSLMQSQLTVVANQVEISPTALSTMTDGTLDQCMTNSIIPMAWSPLAGGRLFEGGLSGEDAELKTRLLAVAEKYGWQLDEMIYLFLLHHPAHIHIVTGSSNINRIKVAHEASHVIISDAQWFEIYTASTGRNVP